MSNNASNEEYHRPDSELQALSREEAQKKLTDKEIKRYNNLKADALEEEIKTQKQKDEEQASEALGVLVDSAQDELTETISFDGTELEVYVDPNIKDYQELNKMMKFKDRKPEQIPPEQLEKMEDKLLGLLAKTSVNYSKEDWRKQFEDTGFRTKALVLNKVFSKVDEDFKQKKSR